MKQLIVLLAAGLLIAAAGTGAQEKFDLMDLVGQWEGEGMFLMPVTNVEVNIEGEGEFVYDAVNDRIRTSMRGTKFMIAYSDSGYLTHYPESDSVSWEVWDSWGKHALYWGEIRDDKLVADRIHRSKNYTVTVEFPHPDTLDFRLTVRNPNEEPYEKARFLLWRVK